MVIREECDLQEEQIEQHLRAHKQAYEANKAAAVVIFAERVADHARLHVVQVNVPYGLTLLSFLITTLVARLR